MPHFCHFHVQQDFRVRVVRFCHRKWVCYCYRALYIEFADINHYSSGTTADLKSRSFTSTLTALRPTSATFSFARIVRLPARLMTPVSLPTLLGLARRSL